MNPFSVRIVRKASANGSMARIKLIESKTLLNNIAGTIKLFTVHLVKNDREFSDKIQILQNLPKLK